MDRKSLSEEIGQEMVELFAAELTRATPGLVGADLDGMEQRLQALGRRVFGRVVEQTVGVDSVVASPMVTVYKIPSSGVEGHAQASAPGPDASPRTAPW